VTLSPISVKIRLLFVSCAFVAIMTAIAIDLDTNRQTTGPAAALRATAPVRIAPLEPLPSVDPSLRALSDPVEPCRNPSPPLSRHHPRGSHELPRR